MKKRKRVVKARAKSPPQITLGGDVGRVVWKRYIMPLLKKDISTREIGEMLGVSHMTVARWRSAYI
jgi:transposase-like protein